jgi:hypothetical protein
MQENQQPDSDDVLADVIRAFAPHFIRYMEEHGTEGSTE